MRVGIQLFDVLAGWLTDLPNGWPMTRCLANRVFSPKNIPNHPIDESTEAIPSVMMAYFEKHFFVTVHRGGLFADRNMRAFFRCNLSPQMVACHGLPDAPNSIFFVIHPNANCSVLLLLQTFTITFLGDLCVVALPTRILASITVPAVLAAWVAGGGWHSHHCFFGPFPPSFSF